jgi:DNA-directed RNA polymerase specialized sigma24 family protein
MPHWLWLGVVQNALQYRRIVKSDMGEQENFDRFLNWLNPDRELAGKRYEMIRRRLIVIFTSKGKDQPEKMADNCIDIVIRKAQEIVPTYHGDPLNYFLGVARNVIKKMDPKFVPVEEVDVSEDTVGRQTETERRYGCLEQCLDQIGSASRELVLEYNRHKGKAKIDQHAALAKQLGITVNALRIRAHRIRETLESCVKRCVEATE